MVADLVERFSRDRKVFLSPDYKEEQLRAEFLSLCFEWLGWDVDISLTWFVPELPDGTGNPNRRRRREMTHRTTWGVSRFSLLLLACIAWAQPDGDTARCAEQHTKVPG